MIEKEYETKGREESEVLYDTDSAASDFNGSN